MTFGHVFDMGVALALAFFVFRGMSRGLTGEIISLIGLIGSVFGGWTFSQPMAAAILGYFPAWSPTITQLVCAVAIFMGVSLVFSVVSKIMRALVRAANLTPMDHIMGAAAGVLRIFIMVLFVYWLMSFLSPVIPSDWMADSMAMQTASTVWPTVLQMMTSSGLDPSRLTSLNI